MILDTVLEQTKAERAPEESHARYFLIFAAERVTKDLDLSSEELESGFVDGGGDGGVDAMYVLVNSVLLQEDTDLDDVKGNVTIDVILLQCSTSGGFKKAAVDRLATSSRDLLDLATRFVDARDTYNQDLLDVADRFREAVKTYASKFPDVRIRYCYATKGDTAEIHGSVVRAAEQLRQTVSGLHSSASVVVELLGARELITLARQVPSKSIVLQIVGTPVTTEDNSYICLVTLREYYRFITQEEPRRLKRHLFESNVRDYEGDVRVNRAIRDSLLNPSGVDFWWLNNGVTVLAERIVASGRSLTLANPLIVNGLQTSFEIYDYFASGNVGDERMLLMRIIETDDPAIRDRIIAATDTQTPIPEAWLKSTGELHRDIEDFLRQHGLYYDRRKNYYRNTGRPKKSIVSIPYLAQAVMAIALREPDNARARPSTLLKSEDDYSRVFSPAHPLPLYLFCVRLLRAVEEALRGPEFDLAGRDINNVKFHVALLVAGVMTDMRAPTAERLAGLADSQFDAALIGQSARRVLAIYQKLGATDQVAKGPQFARRVETELRNRGQ
jgi:hypothetical protein